jgi:hypothetical protein
MTSNRKGAIAELKIATAATELGIPVLRPMTEHGRYDLGFEIGGRILRVQCKWGALDDARAVIRVNLQTYCLTYVGQRRTSYTEDEIDLLAVYCGCTGPLLPSPKRTGGELQGDLSTGRTHSQPAESVR